jgi:putative sigma-54 modulation protein
MNVSVLPPERLNEVEIRRSFMQLDLSGHHVEVTDSMRGYVLKKFEKISRHFEQVLDIHCVLTVEKLRHKAEATLMMRGNKIYADATEENMYAAIDALSDKLDRCVKKHKEKSSDHHAEEVIKARTTSS